MTGKGTYKTNDKGEDEYTPGPKTNRYTVIEAHKDGHYPVRVGSIPLKKDGGIDMKKWEKELEKKGS